MQDEYLIKDYVDALRSFSEDLLSFFSKFEQKTLFNQLPAKESVEKVNERLKTGRYLLRSDEFKFNPEESKEAAFELIDILKTHLPNRIEEINNIKKHFISEDADLISLLEFIFGNKGDELINLAKKKSLKEDLITFFAVYFARPFRLFAADYLIEDINLRYWSRGFCPVCGHWPSIGHVRSGDGRRTLWCLQCSTKWEFKHLQCVYCLNDDRNKLGILSKQNEKNYRFQVCHVCSKYLKEVHTKTPIEKFSFDNFYLGSTILDLIANREGYTQESSLTVRYDDPEGDEILTYLQLKDTNDSFDEN